ncbi:ribosome hibernation-promoting factor, HPF/YfiA family [Pseudopontixanthobacter vadosimaris]|uniref:ribosome hibernation-promoting factor, HPF/YfiA family n=1 Tax=Pseudopontixanthobacter vadosimaris TaxID=2726450 RepID=UPI001475D775|nr:ribosome-associated translation inhibitor RaiA [Pseudopontixanthobacter vadosimaris]
MDIRVSGHQMETGAALQDHASDRLNAMVDKYFRGGLSSHATFGKGPQGAFTCDIVMHVRQGLTVKSRGEAHEAHQAFEQAAGKLDKQLRRYKRRLKDRHEQADHAMQMEDAAYTVFAPFSESQHDDADGADDGGHDAEGDAPLIVAETRVDIPETSVADAVMMLDLRDTGALLFKNAGSGRHNMVYRREDGSIGWVEPQ